MDTTTPYGRPRKTFVPDRTVALDAVRDAGRAFNDKRRDAEGARYMLEVAVEDALRGGLHYMDIARAAGISKKMPWRILRQLEAEGVPVAGDADPELS